MSIKIMTLVWDKSPLKGTELLILLALADMANDDGVCWPSYDTIAQRARVSRRYAISVVGGLIDTGVVSKSYRSDNNGDQTSNYYRINPVMIGEGGEPQFTGGVNPSSLGSEPQFTTLVNPSSPKSSINHQLTINDDDAKSENSQSRPNSFRAFEQEIGPLTPMVAEALKDFEQTYSEQWTVAAIREASAHGARNLAYITAVLKGWKSNGFGNRPQDRKKSPIASQHEMTIDEMLEASVKP